LEPAVRVTIGVKIFGIAVGLLILMAVVALLSMRMTRTVDDQLVIIDHNYFPAYVALAQANIHSVEESAYARRLLLATAERPDNTAKVDNLRQRIANAGMKTSLRRASTSTNRSLIPSTLTTTSL
jgi:hypothetical protein